MQYEKANQHVCGHKVWTRQSTCLRPHYNKQMQCERTQENRIWARNPRTCLRRANTHKKSHIDTSINTLVVTTKYNVSKAMNMLVVTTNTNTITWINVLLSTTKSPHNMHCEHGLQPTCEFGVLSCVRTWHVVHLAWSRLFLFLCVVHYICTCNQCTTHTTKRYGTTYTKQMHDTIRPFTESCRHRSHSFFRRFTPGYNKLTSLTRVFSAGGAISFGGRWLTSKCKLCSNMS